MTLREGGVLKPSKCRYMGRGRFDQIVIRGITFEVAKKLNLQFILLSLRYMWEGLVENVIWGEGFGGKVRIPSY